MQGYPFVFFGEGGLLFIFGVDLKGKNKNKKPLTIYKILVPVTNGYLKPTFYRKYNNFFKVV